MLNNRQQCNVTETIHGPVPIVSYKPQTPNDDVLRAFAEDKQPYLASSNQPEHPAQQHLFHIEQPNHVKSEFYDVTLDLSHDDIQQTLSANMPATCANADQLLR